MEIEATTWGRDSYSVRFCRCGAPLASTADSSAAQHCRSCGRRIRR